MLPPSVPRRAALGLALCAAACAPHAAEGPAAAAPAGEREVRTAAVREEPWEELLRVTGELSAFEQATLSAKLPGRLEHLAVDLGDRVVKGQEIARIEARDLELRLAQSEAALEAARARLGMTSDGADGHVEPEEIAIVREARAELDAARLERQRFADLRAQGVAAISALDAVEARFQVAESRWLGSLDEVANRRALLDLRAAELELARAELADARIVAPFDGALAERLAGTGDYLAVGAPIARLVRFDPVRVRLEVPERSAAGVRAGQEVRVRVEGIATPAVGRLARLGPELAARSRTLIAEADLANADGSLRPGSFVRAEIVLDPDARARVVPAEALVRFAGVDKVFTVEGGIAAQRLVVIGRVDARRVEILSGLAAGEQVVLSPGGLQSGERVRAAR